MIKKDSDDESRARRTLAMLQNALDEEDYLECVKILENWGNEGVEFCKSMADLHHKEGKDLKNKLYEEGELHLQKAIEAQEAGDFSTADIEFMNSLKAFLPSIESIKVREAAKKHKEEFQKRKQKQNLNLTTREQEVFNLLLTGTAPKEIAYNLKISYPTVNFHMNNLYRKLGIQSRAELFAKYGK